jgi:hypothetical protein
MHGRSSLRSLSLRLAGAALSLIPLLWIAQSEPAFATYCLQVDRRHLSDRILHAAPAVTSGCDQLKSVLPEKDLLARTKMSILLGSS